MLKINKTMTSKKVIEMLEEMGYGYEVAYEYDSNGNPTDEVNSISYVEDKEFNEYMDEVFEIEFNEFDLVEEHYQWDE